MKLMVLLTIALMLTSPLIAASATDAHTILASFAERGSEITKTLTELLRERKRTNNKKRQQQLNDAKKAEQQQCDTAIKKISEEHKARKKNLQTACAARKKELTAQAKTEKAELSHVTKQAISALQRARSKASRRYHDVAHHLAAVTDFFTTLKTHAREAELPDVVTLITQEEARLSRESRTLAPAA